MKAAKLGDWIRMAHNGGINYKNKYQPFLRGKYYFEKRYFDKGERLSWSHHDSFVLLGYDSRSIEILNDIFGYLARCFGMEVIDVHSYYLYSSGDFQVGSMRQQIEEKGYFYGSLPLKRLKNIGQGLKKILFVQHPVVVLLQEFHNSEEEELSNFLLDQQNWKMFESIADLKCGDDYMLVRLEELYDEPIRILVDTMLFICGHEPHALVRDVVEDFLPNKKIDVLMSSVSLTEIDKGLITEVCMKNKLVLEALGYQESGMSESKTYSSSSLQRMI
jgi:hypothetical protein